MGLFQDVMRSLSGGTPSTPPNPSSSGSAGLRRVEACCAQLGWGIDERVGTTGLVLHFKDPVVNIRQILVTVGDGGQLGIVSAFSTADLAPRRLPADLGWHLLVRNAEAHFGAWQLRENDSGNASFACAYTVLVGGLDAPTFKFICESLCKEVHALDAKLQQAGLL